MARVLETGCALTSHYSPESPGDTQGYRYLNVSLGGDEVPILRFSVDKYLEKGADFAVAGLPKTGFYTLPKFRNDFELMTYARSPDQL